MTRRTYTVGERAIIAIGAAAGKSQAEINDALRVNAKRGAFRPVNPTSLGMASRYPTLPAADAQALWEHILHPKPLGAT
jgi:hypothetical protein